MARMQLIVDLSTDDDDPVAAATVAEALVELGLRMTPAGLARRTGRLIVDRHGRAAAMAVWFALDDDALLRLTASELVERALDVVAIGFG